FQVNTEPVTVTPNSQAEREAPFVISAPANDRLDSLNVEPNAEFQISIPDLPADLAPTANVSNDSAHAIPLPPAVESGITGIVALGLGAGLKRLRRALR